MHAHTCTHAQSQPTHSFIHSLLHIILRSTVEEIGIPETINLVRQLMYNTKNTTFLQWNPQGFINTDRQHSIKDDIPKSLSRFSTFIGL